MDSIVTQGIIIAIATLTGAVITAIPAYAKLSEKKSFSIRDDSDDPWYKDMANANKLVFLGINHESLGHYLSKLKDRIGKCEVENIQIVYASSKFGSLVDGEEFYKKIVDSRQNICALFASSEWKECFPKLQHLSFFQTTYVHNFQGTLICVDNDNCKVIYVVDYLHIGEDAKKSITFRYKLPSISFFNKRARNVINSYLSSYQEIMLNAQKIVDCENSLWDMSASDWRNFSKNCKAHRSSMRKLLEFSEIKGAESVLDLAAGTGDVSKLIIDAYPEANLTVLDASPVMIKYCRQVLGHNVHYALAKVPSNESDIAIDLLSPFDTYDFIFIHLSIPAIASDYEELCELANWCKKHLSNNGKVIIAIQNTIIEDISSVFSVKHDELRKTIRNESERMGFKKITRQLHKSAIKSKDIKEAFNLSGLKEEKTDIQKFSMEISDRLLMWSSPAILNDEIEAEKVSAKERRILLGNIANIMSNTPTQEMTVKYWCYSMKSSLAPQLPRLIHTN